MKSKTNVMRLFGIAAFTAVIVFTMTACNKGGGGSSSGGNNSVAANEDFDWDKIEQLADEVFDSGGSSEAKTITITGLDGITGTAGIEVKDVKADGDISDIAQSRISWSGFQIENDSVTLPLIILDGTGIGSYTLRLVLYDDPSEPIHGCLYFYTDGKTWEQLGIDSGSWVPELPKYNISSAASTIPFSKFQKSGEQGYSSGNHP